MTTLAVSLYFLGWPMAAVANEHLTDGAPQPLWRELLWCATWPISGMALLLLMLTEL